MKWWRWRDQWVERAANLARGAGWEVRWVQIASTGSAYLRLACRRRAAVPGLEATVRISNHRPFNLGGMFSVHQRDSERLNDLVAWLNRLVRSTRA